MKETLTPPWKWQLPHHLHLPKSTARTFEGSLERARQSSGGIFANSESWHLLDVDQHCERLRLGNLVYDDTSCDISCYLRSLSTGVPPRTLSHQARVTAASQYSQWE